MYLAPPWFKKGGNFTAECVVRVLSELAQLRPLPPTLYLQGDNGTDNKNRTIIGLNTFLVARGVVKRLEHIFLLSGHTHEDVDQRFRVISGHLDKHTALTPSALAKIIADAFSAPTTRRANHPIQRGDREPRKPEVVTLRGVHGFAALLHPCI